MITRRFRLRSIDFIGEREYPQGLGMTWNDIDVVVDLAEGEKVYGTERDWFPGRGADAEVPYVRVWVMTPVAERPL